MGDPTTGDIALILWGVYLVILMFRMVAWCAKGAVEETHAALCDTIDNAVKRGTEDALARIKEAKERRERS